MRVDPFVLLENAPEPAGAGSAERDGRLGASAATGILAVGHQSAPAVQIRQRFAEQLDRLDPRQDAHRASPSLFLRRIGNVDYLPVTLVPRTKHFYIRCATCGSCSSSPFVSLSVQISAFSRNLLSTSSIWWPLCPFTQIFFCK